MIYFIHNTFNRPKQVIRHSLIEKELYPDCKHLIVYNNPKIIFEEINDITYFYFGDNKKHKAGSINSVYSGLKYLLENNNITDNDIIVFSHDDIYLCNNDKFSYYINMMKQYDFISRRVIDNKHVPDNCIFYIMMESFLIKPNLARVLTENYIYNEINEEDLLKDKLNSYSPEMNFGKDILSNTDKYFLIDINENVYGENDLGYFHIKNERGSGEF
jgi:hypothetical protein